MIGLLSWLFGIATFILGIFAIVGIINSTAPMPQKLLWIAGVVLFPVIGFVGWFFFGPKMTVPRR